jgi:aquaporin Z
VAVAVFGREDPDVNTIQTAETPMLRKAVVEGIGTFFLVLTIGMVVLEPGAGAFAPIAIGSILMVMIFAGGHVSGGHYNPAVSLGVFVRGRMSAPEMFAYWAAQLAGAALAMVAVRTLKGAVTVVPIAPAVGAAFLAEFLFTFALVYVVLNVATARKNDGNSHYGLAIGFTVMVGAYSVGAISGGAFNPAVAVGITMLGIVPAASLWIYLAANLLGGAAAGVLFNALDLGLDRQAAPAVQAAASPAATLRT